MRIWCMAHPWMTFFLLMMLIMAASNIASSIATAFASKNQKDDCNCKNKHAEKNRKEGIDDARPF